jgi:hypothetical protein
VGGISGINLVENSATPLMSPITSVNFSLHDQLVGSDASRVEKSRPRFCFWRVYACCRKTHQPIRGVKAMQISDSCRLITYVKSAVAW